MRFILAHDLGTSGNKATLYAEDGALVASRTHAYPTRFFNGNWAEQEPSDWWRAICDSTRSLLAHTRTDPADIAAVSLSGQMMGCTPVDREGRALRPSILYCDQRATKEAEALLTRIDMPSFYAITGHRCAAVYVLQKLMWLKANEPEIYAKTYKTLCAKDYVNFHLCGRMATDYSDASGTNAFDLNTFTWSDKLLALAGISPDLFPEALPSTAILGGITERAAAETGLKAGTPVAAGGGDGSCAGVGVGCIKPGTVYNYLGSSSWVALTVEKPIVDPQMRTMNWAHCVPGYLHPSGSVQTAGSAHTWLKNQLCDAEKRQAAATGESVYALMDRVIERVPAGSNGLLFLPYMLGERTPWWNPKARGAFIGLNLASTREEMMRAVLEGITLNLGIIVNLFRQHVPIDRITVIGGGAKGALWRQMMADIYGCRVESLRDLEEATSMGAAVIGGVACGLFADFEVIHRFIRVANTAEPSPDQRAVYLKLMPIFEKAYLGLVGVYDDLAALQTKP